MRIIPPRRSLVLRLSLLLAAVFLVAYVSISAVVVYGVRNYLQGGTQQELHILASERLARIDRELSDQLTELRAWSHLEVMNDVIAGDVDQRIAITLAQMKAQYNLPGDIYAFNARGQLVATSLTRPLKRKSMPPIWRAAVRRHESFIDKHVDPYGGHNALAFIAPLHASFANRTRIGTLVLTYPWRTVASQLHPRSAALVVMDDSPGHRVLYSGIPASRLATMGRGCSEERATLRGPKNRFIAGYARGPILSVGTSRAGSNAHPIVNRWEVCALRPVSDNWLVPLDLAWRWLVLGGLLIGLPAGALILWLSRAFVRPILELTDAAVAISDSEDLSAHTVKVQSHDEIGLLQKSFNRMLLRLRGAFEAQTAATTQLVSLNEQLKDMALTDSLTNLPNRRAAEARFLEGMSRAKRKGTGFALVICDLDNFKLVNDRYGHEVGDRLLRHAAETLKASVRLDDWVARWGGEEFILFLDDIDSAEAILVIERVRLAIKSTPFELQNPPITITASFGVSVASGGNTSIQRLLAEADERLYTAKKRGRDAVVGPDHPVCRTLQRASDLQLALQEDRVVPAYQVMVELATDTVVATEALARLQLPDGRILTAAEFVEAAEDTNLIHKVDQAISRQAITHCCEVLCREHATRVAHFINLSPHSLARDELVESILSRLPTSCDGCVARMNARTPIVVEVTERQLINDFKTLRRTLQPLLDVGVRLALDDFGSGYSSFLYLAELEISFVKIDGWMVHNLQTNRTVQRAVQSIVTLAEDLKLTTIGECVQDAETAHILRELGVDWGQGYYFGKPQFQWTPRRPERTAAER